MISHIRHSVNFKNARKIHQFFEAGGVVAVPATTFAFCPLKRAGRAPRQGELFDNAD